jgi:tetratricopeptide (TPR) repeat protein
VSLPYYGCYYRGYPYRYYGWPRRYYCGSPYYQYYYPYPRYNYYEYYRNYYYTPPAERRSRSEDSGTVGPDERPAKRTEQPAEQGKEGVEYVEYNRHLEDVADAFAARDYDKAAKQAEQTLTDEPDNPVVPFVYAQALFAAGKYSQSADVLREALTNLDTDKQQVYYPLGFYRDLTELNDQIAGLTEEAAAKPSDAELQLLLGYQLSGVARYEEALEALQKARPSYVNKEAATVLIDLLEKARATSAPNVNPDS